MPNPLNFVFTLHNHQPVGNGEEVLADAYARCYEPFLSVIERHSDLRFTLHYSGTLLEWLEANRPEFFPRLKKLSDAGRVEILGGGFGEPILVMLPDNDRRGQLEMLSDYLQTQFGKRPQGMWMTERVWEQGLVQGIHAAGLDYTALDDTHFKRAGLGELDLFAPFLTEDRGALLTLFPMDERLRYLIPYGTPEEAIHYMRQVSDGGEGRTIVFGDDGEKFGLWPKSYKHCYEDGWLDRFFSLAAANADWLKTTTLDEVHTLYPAKRRIYLPDASYREMMIWQLPPKESAQFQGLVEASRKERATVPDTFLAAGSWRNFRVKYPESNDMYTKMLSVSRKVARMSQREPESIEARKSLYRGQCNCPYWHGVFGGLYLSHLRAATYRELLSAEYLAEAAKMRPTEAHIHNEDRNLDGEEDIVVSTPRMNLCLIPAYGGHLLAWEFYQKRMNLLSTLTRRPEAYHGRPTSDGKMWKPESGEADYVYDWYKRESLIDHFFGPDARMDNVSKCRFPEDGDFANQPFETTEQKAGRGKILVTMERLGGVWHQGVRLPVRLVKTIRAESKSEDLEVEIEIENRADSEVYFHYGSEWNLAFSQGDAPQRDLFTGAEHTFVSNLGSPRELHPQKHVRLMDGWLGVTLDFHFKEAAAIWTFPVKTLSQSEQGFDENYQGTCFIPRWSVSLKPGGVWKTSYQVHVSLA